MNKRYHRVGMRRVTASCDSVADFSLYSGRAGGTHKVCALYHFTEPPSQQAREDRAGDQVDGGCLPVLTNNGGRAVPTKEPGGPDRAKLGSRGTSQSKRPPAKVGVIDEGHNHFRADALGKT